jgi:hypothetical protein
VDAFRWLHLTDLHWGQTGQKHLWPEIREEFFKDLARLHKKTGPWHAVLFTGDLVFRGDPDEFAQLDSQVFGPLWKCFQELESNPILLTVPGNHDLKRPNEKDDDAAVDWLREPEGYQKIAEKFWANESNPYRDVVHDTFKAYDAWIKDRPYSQGHPIHSGALPGDFSATLTTDGGRRIGIAGLNTTFLQLAAGDYRRAAGLRRAAIPCRLRNRQDQGHGLVRKGTERTRYRTTGRAVELPRSTAVGRRLAAVPAAPVATGCRQRSQPAGVPTTLAAAWNACVARAGWCCCWTPWTKRRRTVRPWRRCAGCW